MLQRSTTGTALQLPANRLGETLPLPRKTAVRLDNTMRRPLFSFLVPVWLWTFAIAPSLTLAQTPDPTTQQLLAMPGSELDANTAALPTAAGLPASAPAEQVPPPALPARRAPGAHPLAPFGHNLFLGNFLRTRHDGLNPEYEVAPGDRVSVQTWGAVELNGVFVVDGQGNLFLPEIGPVQVAGVHSADLSEVVRKHIRSVYVRHFGVYTHLLTARPLAVFVTGGVHRPGSYAGLPSDSLLYFLDQAGGIDPALGSYRHIDLLREGQTVATFDLYDFMLRGQLPHVVFRAGDTVLVQQRGPQITLTGDVAAPALIELNHDQVAGAEVLAVVPASARATDVTWSGVRDQQPFQQTLPVAEFQQVSLQAGDSVQLRAEGRPEAILIHLEGEFEGPSTLSVQRGTRLIDLLNHVAVNPTVSNPTAVHLKRPSVAKAQKDAIEDSLFRLERSALLALSSSNGEASIRVKEAELMQRFAERARLIDPLGRVVTSRHGHPQNLLLEDGDTIVIPEKTGVVRVSGEVQISHASAHRGGLTAADYIQSAGGYTDRAEEDIVLILHANAEVEMVSPDSVVYPGDEILVPPRVDSKILQNAIDITQVIYQIAVAAGVVLGVAL